MSVYVPYTKVKGGLNYLPCEPGSQDANDEFSKLTAHEAKQRLAVLLRRMDTNGDSLISNQEISDWVLNNFRSVWNPGFRHLGNKPVEKPSKNLHQT